MLKFWVNYRIYEPLEKAIMTIEEANLSEEILEETLAKVQERKVLYMNITSSYVLL